MMIGNRPQRFARFWCLEILGLVAIFDCRVQSTNSPKCFIMVTSTEICVADDFTITTSTGVSVTHDEHSTHLLVADNVFVLCNNNWYRKSDGTLKPKGLIEFSHGTDKLGSFQAAMVQWIAGTTSGISNTSSSNTLITTTVKVYTGSPHAIVKFTQGFPTGCTNYVKPDIGSNGEATNSGFPVFNATTSAASRSNFITFGAAEEYGAIVGNGWSSSMTSAYHGVPMIFHDADANTVAFAPVDNFLVNMLGVSPSTRALSVGMQSSITTTPAAHNMSFVMVLGKGIQNTIDVLGALLHSEYNRTPACMAFTRDLRLLGYYSDNGACYYYNTEPNMTYEDTYARLFDEASTKKIPYGFYHLDSFFYTKDSGAGVGVCDVNKVHASGSAGSIEWDGCTNLFPLGLGHLSNAILNGSNLSAHARLFSDHTIYAQGNLPGNHSYDRQFPFVKDASKQAAIPTTNVSAAFWNFLISDAATRWNLAMYEQDWTATIYGDNDILHSDLEAGSVWLTTMAAAAAQHNVGVGYGSAWSGDTMHQLTTPAARWV